MNTIRMIVGGMIGLFFGAGAALAVSPGLAGFWVRNDEIGGLILILLIAAGGLLGFFAPTIRRAFGRSLILLGLSVAFLPISGMLLAGRFPAEVTDVASTSSAYVLVGAGLAGVAVNSVASILGMLFGAILMGAGVVLCLGGRREGLVARATAPVTVAE